MPITCASCRRENDPWRKFCGGCGSSLPGSCKGCGHVNRLDDRFCGGCGKTVRALPSIVKSQQTVPIEIGDVISETEV